MNRFITTWRKTEQVLEWDYHISQDLAEAERVVENIKQRGVIQFYTYPIGDAPIANLTCDFGRN